MRLLAEHVRPGDRIQGSEVAWVLPVQNERTVMVGLSRTVRDGRRGSAKRVRRYRLGDVVDVESRPGLRRDLSRSD
jgi:hypothetical protein